MTDSAIICRRSSILLVKRTRFIDSDYCADPNVETLTEFLLGGSKSDYQWTITSVASQRFWLDKSVHASQN